MKKMIVLAVLMFCMISTSFAFSDVNEEHWAFKDITEMQRMGIIYGFEDGTFRPEETVTREQTAVILTNAFDLKLKGTKSNFMDTKEDRWSKYYIDIVGEYVDGIDGNFLPEENTTRIAIAKSILNLLYLNTEKTDLSVIDKFTDKDTFSNEDKNIIANVCSNKIMKGKGEKFEPYSYLTRAEACALVNNLLKNNEVLTRNDEKIVFTVNGEKITVSDFKLYCKLQSKFYETWVGNRFVWNVEKDGVSGYDEIKKIAKDEIVGTTLKLQKAKEYKIEVPEEELNALKADMTSDMTKSLAEFYKVTPQDIYKIKSEDLIIGELSKQIYKDLDHSEHTHPDIDKPVDNFFYDARHILLFTYGKTEEEANNVKILASELLERVKAGEDFGTLAKEYSEDAGSKDNSGLYENINLGEFVSEFETAALSMEPGQIYPEIVKSSYGYHIIKTEGKRTEQIMLSEETKAEIIQTDFAAEVKKWLDLANVETNEELYDMI